MAYRIRAGSSVIVFDRREARLTTHDLREDRVFKDSDVLLDGTGNCLPEHMGRSLVAAGYTLFKTEEVRWPSIAVPTCELEVI